MSYASEKIKSLKEVMSKIDPTSEQYKAYGDIIFELEHIVAKENRPQVVVHKDPNDQICESCQ